MGLKDQIDQFNNDVMVALSRQNRPLSSETLFRTVCLISQEGNFQGTGCPRILG